MLTDDSQQSKTDHNNSVEHLVFRQVNNQIEKYCQFYNRVTFVNSFQPCKSKIHTKTTKIIYQASLQRETTQGILIQQVYKKKC